MRLLLLFWLGLAFTACHTLNTGHAPANKPRGAHKALYANHQEFQKTLLEPYLQVLNSLLGNGALFGNYKIPLFVTEAPRGGQIARLRSTCFFWVACTQSDASGKMPLVVHSMDAHIMTVFFGIYVERELIVNGHAEGWSAPTDPSESPPADGPPETGPTTPTRPDGAGQPVPAQPPGPAGPPTVQP